MSKERTEQAERAASEWLAHRYSGDWSDEDQAALARWMDASTEHRVAYLRLELAWRQSDRLKALGAGTQDLAPPPPGQWTLTPFFEADTVDREDSRDPAAAQAPVTPKNRRRTLAIAASIVLAITAGLATYLFWPAGRAYETDIGAIASVPMPDGSSVTLNTDSEVRIEVSQKERRIELTHGEAFFDVAPDPTRPFIVAAGSRRVIAVGTRFSVRRDGDDVQVVVTEGKVRIEGGAGAAPYLSAGTVARASRSGVLVQTKAIAEAEEQLSWRAGILIFRNQSLADAIAEFNRYNIRKIIVEDPTLAALRIEGNFRSNNVDAFVRLLEQVYGISVSQDEQRIVLRK